MTGEAKDARGFFVTKKHKLEHEIKPKLSHVDSCLYCSNLRNKITKAKAEFKAMDNIRQYNHNLGTTLATKV